MFSIFNFNKFNSLISVNNVFNVSLPDTCFNLICMNKMTLCPERYYRISNWQFVFSKWSKFLWIILVNWFVDVILDKLCIYRFRFPIEIYYLFCWNIKNVLFLLWFLILPLMWFVSLWSVSSRKVLLFIYLWIWFIIFGQLNVGINVFSLFFPS